jgi:transposase
VITLAPGLRVYLACGVTDMRKGMIGLAMLVQQSLREDPFGGAVYAFRGRRAGLIKLIWHDGVGLCMLTKRLERGQFLWPSSSTTGRIALSAPQLAALLDGCVDDGPQGQSRAGKGHSARRTAGSSRPRTRLLPIAEEDEPTWRRPKKGDRSWATPPSCWEIWMARPRFTKRGGPW